MKKYGWTLVELTIAIIVIMLLSAMSMSITKNININKNKIYIYAALRNLSMGHIAIMEMPANNGSFYPDTAQTSDSNNSIPNDWYCMYLSDGFSLVANPNCAKTASSTTVNLRFPNGITFYGMASPWNVVHSTDYKTLYYKSIMIDADGEGGMNKIGVDRFPMYVFRGSTDRGVSIDGMVIPTECGKNYIYKDGGTTKYNLTNTYCDGKTNNLASDNTVISQNIYRVTDGKNTTKATIIAGRMSTIEADCKAYAGTGFYTRYHCSEYGIKLHERCAHEITCENCATNGNICPATAASVDLCNGLAETNKISVKNPDTGANENQGFQCFSLLNKPSSGLGMVGSSIFGDMDI